MNLSIGQTTGLSHTFTQGDFDRFAALTGDDNPIHVDPIFAASTRFGGTVAHGMLLYSTICHLLGTRLPGPGALQLEQDLMFPAPIFAGEEVTIQVEVTSQITEMGLAELSTIITKPNGELGCQGRTLVRLPGSHPAFLEPKTTTPSPPSEARTLRGIVLGQRATTKRTFTEADLLEYADLAGDNNPLYTKGDYAQQLGLRGAILPGGLLAGLFSDLLGTELPGRGTNWLKQTLRFLAPAYPGEPLTASVEVIRLRPQKDLVTLRTACTNPQGENVCMGESLVLVKDLEL